MEKTVICGSCGARVPAYHRFCGTCGAPVKGRRLSAPQPTAIYESIAPSVHARLVRVQAGEKDGLVYPLDSSTQGVGRERGEILFPGDPYISPRHASFYFDKDTLFVRDEGSTNGVFLRISDAVRLEDGDQFLVGEEVFEFRSNSAQLGVLSPDLTHFFGSQPPLSFRRLVHILDGGRIGSTHFFDRPKILIGREGCDLDFPDDRFISGHHCTIQFDGPSMILTDANSRNGTYIKIRGPAALKQGDHVFLGKQLLRVEFS